MEFQVDEIIGGKIVTGRNCNSDIPVGTIFTKITKSKVTGEISNLQSVDMGKVANIKLKLKGVSCYHRMINVIPAGYTAGLMFEGQGLDLLQSELDKLKSKEYVHIKA